MSGRSLVDWLSYQEKLHPNVIDLGLERLTRVLERLAWRALDRPVVTIGGTNGKGSCVAMLDSILSSHGYRVGTFTSPHLIRYNERIRIAGREVSDDELIAAFERIEAARGEISITFFEFNTLAALLIFEASSLDAIVLEVGLGGRLDAVNVVDADVAIVTSIGLDHCEWLGYDVESIARWKAGIFRSERPALFGARVMPAAIVDEAARIGARLQRLGFDFDYKANADSWDWRGRLELDGLPLPALRGALQFDNAATALAAIDCLRADLPVSRTAIEQGLRDVSLPGRFQIMRSTRDEKAPWLLDVAHNPAAAETLAGNLRLRTVAGKTIAVFGMFADKDVDGVIAAVGRQVDGWIVVDVNGARALPANAIAQKISAAGGQVLYVARSVVDGCVHAMSIAAPEDRIVAFGSFHTVGPVLEWLQAESFK